MLTRLKVNGFKNLVDVDIRFGPFTCIAGANGVGKSNLFDAISFLGDLSEKTLMDAALAVRGEGGRASGVSRLFCLAGREAATEMSFEAEMLIPPRGVDKLGQEAEATTTFVRYGLEIGRRDDRLEILRENLEPIGKQAAAKHLQFPHTRAWRDSVVRGRGRRGSLFVSTEEKAGLVRLHQDRGPNSPGGGRPRQYVAAQLPRTVLSDANAAENSTAVLVGQEMRSWSLLQLEPSALRRPDEFRAERSLALNGEHLAATLARLAKVRLDPMMARAEEVAEEDPETARVYAELAGRLSELLPEVRSLRVDVDLRRELLTLMLEETGGIEHPANSLSDGTLRFLALAVLARDPEATGVLCLEEPENGIHPERIPAMLRLLEDLAVDPKYTVDETNPLQQVIVNTHSPVFAAQASEESVLMASQSYQMVDGGSLTAPVFHPLSGTWRTLAEPTSRSVSLGQLVAYLQPLEPLSEFQQQREGLSPQRVMDREDLRRELF